LTKWRILCTCQHPSQKSNSFLNLPFSRMQLMFLPFIFFRWWIF
jgi:hypothetical protein